jgi:CheY-like chemotaxis protein
MSEPPSASLRILLVDDCPDMRSTLGLLLGLWGHEIRTVADGVACLAAVEEYLPHVILLDIGLPGMDGFEVACRLRAGPQSEPAPHIITLSGFGRDEDFERSQRVGCERHLVKPVNLRDLQLMLADYAEQLQPI